MDEFDRASELEMAERSPAISTQQKNIKQVTFSHCQDCGVEIPKQRQAVKGVTRCIDCQQLEEKQRLRYAK